MNKEGITKYKLNRIAIESLRNSIRLHFDAILLYENGSFPSAFQLSILSLEELSKAAWVDHYIWTSETNEGYPDVNSELDWLDLLYQHPKKQWNFVSRESNYFSPNFIKQIQDRKLEEKKQNSVYVGLIRVKGKVNTRGRVSTPCVIKLKDAKQVISIINNELLNICSRIEEDEFYYEGATGMNEVLNYEIYFHLLKWPHKSGLKNSSWIKKNQYLNYSHG